MLDYSFNVLSDEKLQDDERTGYHDLCESSFSNLFNDEFSVFLNSGNTKNFFKNVDVFEFKLQKIKK